MIYILILAALVSLVIRIYLAINSIHTADLYLMHIMGSKFLEGKNPYLVLDFNSYPPIAIFIEAICIKLSYLLNLHFQLVLKIWLNLADFVTAFLLFKILIKQKVNYPKAILWTSLFLLNPISIIISSAHGQMESMTNLFTLLSIYIVLFRGKKFIYLAGLFLGIAIGIKPNPLMLFPIFLFYQKYNLKNVFIFGVFTILPLLVSLLPFLGQKPLEIIFRMLGYSGVYDMSYAAILRGVWWQDNAQIFIPYSLEFLNTSKIFFLSYLGIIFLIFLKTQKLFQSIFLTYLGFITFYFGISVQYLVWVTPFAIILKETRVLGYLLLGTLSMVSFYLYFGPEILLGNIYKINPFQIKYFYWYFLFNSLFWFYNIFWIIKFLKPDFKKNYKLFNKIEKNIFKLQIILLICFLFIFLFYVQKLIFLFLENNLI